MAGGMIFVIALLLLWHVIALAGVCPCLSCVLPFNDSTTCNGDAVFSLIVGGAGIKADT